MNKEGTGPNHTGLFKFYLKKLQGFVWITKHIPIWCLSTCSTVPFFRIFTHLKISCRKWFSKRKYFSCCYYYFDNLAIRYNQNSWWFSAKGNLRIKNTANNKKHVLWPLALYLCLNQKTTFSNAVLKTYMNFFCRKEFVWDGTAF